MSHQLDLLAAAGAGAIQPPAPPARKLAEEGRDRGMKQAYDHAVEVQPDWGSIAYRLVLEFVQQPGVETFLAEDVRAWARGRYSEPPSQRAWGAVFVRAAKAGLISKAGYALAKREEGHRQPSTLWRITR